METKEKVLSQHLIIGLFLALAGGWIDAYTYLTRDGVFAFAQTANIILLSVKAVTGDFGSIVAYLCPILSFAVGLFLCKLLSRYLRIRDRERLLILGIEMALLCVIGTLNLSVPNLVVTGCVSLISALQFGSFRLLDGYPYATTMCTGNLRVMVDSMFDCIFDKNKEAGIKSLKYLAVLLSFAGGAALSAFLAGVWSIYSVLFALIPLFGVAVALTIDEVRAVRRAKAEKEALDKSTEIQKDKEELL